MPSNCPRGLRPARAAAGAIVLALALACAPAAAHGYSLRHLLQMPLERLLQLQISVPGPTR